MAKRISTLTAAAGEHYVAYRLSIEGYVVALPRAGVPAIDLLVADLERISAIFIQVKASESARREPKDPQNHHWEWDVGQNAFGLSANSILYAFVDLKRGDQTCTGSIQKPPDVFIVPSETIAKGLSQNKRPRVWIMEYEKNDYLNRWDLVKKALNESTSPVGRN